MMTMMMITMMMVPSDRGPEQLGWVGCHHNSFVAGDDDGEADDDHVDDDDDGDDDDNDDEGQWQQGWADPWPNEEASLNNNCKRKCDSASLNNKCNFVFVAGGKLWSGWVLITGRWGWGIPGTLHSEKFQAKESTEIKLFIGQEMKLKTML